MNAVPELSWWVWLLIAAGVISIVAVISALFLPDWNEPENLATPFDAAPASETFVAGTAAYFNVPVLRGGRATVLQNGDEFFPAMLEAIRAAQDTVNFQVYIFEPEGIGAQFLAAFQERARAGVEVRLMVDAFGSSKLDGEHRRALREAGCRVSRFRPLKLLTLVRVFKRDHRRAIVVDGRIAFTGGGAIAEKWTGHAQDEHHWRENMTRVTGPLAEGVQAAFVENWVYCTGEVLTGSRFFPYGVGAAQPAPARHPVEAEAALSFGPTGGWSARSGGIPPGASDPREPETLGVSVVSSPSDSAQPIRLLFWLSFTCARERILISSSYFVPSRRIRAAVIERAQAGVDVRILVPGPRTDAKPVRLAGRSFYEELLAAGVRIWEYQPTMMHAKTVVVDGAWSIVGSSNMDERSTALNEENNLAVRDVGLARQLEAGLMADIAQSEEIRLDEWRRRGWGGRIKERLCMALIQQY